MDFRVSVENLSEVQQELKELSKFSESRKEVRKGLKEAGRYLIKKGKERLKSRMKMKRKDRTGNLLKSFKHRIKKKNAGVLVGFKAGKKGGNQAWYISAGTKPRKTGKGYSRGRVLPNNFWSDTREQDTPRAMNIVVDHINLAIEAIKSRR